MENELYSSPNGRFGFSLTGGKRGTYYGHGGLFWNSNKTKGLPTGMLAFPDGIDAVLMVNTLYDGPSPVAILKNAYDNSF